MSNKVFRFASYLLGEGKDINEAWDDVLEAILSYSYDYDPDEVIKIYNTLDAAYNDFAPSYLELLNFIQDICVNTDVMTEVWSEPEMRYKYAELYDWLSKNLYTNTKQE